MQKTQVSDKLCYFLTLYLDNNDTYLCLATFSLSFHGIYMKIHDSLFSTTWLYVLSEGALLLRIWTTIISYFVFSQEEAQELEEEKEEPDRLTQLLPQSKFACGGKKTGYYADEGLDCEVFHYCQDNARHSWICPEGFVFHQVRYSKTILRVVRTRTGGV